MDYNALPGPPVTSEAVHSNNDALPRPPVASEVVHSTGLICSISGVIG